MAPASVQARDRDPIRPRTWLLVPFVALASASIYAAVRLGVPVGITEFRGTCERLVRAGIAVGSHDPVCGSDVSRERILFLLASVTAGIGLAWPPAVLAATGRRLSALTPLIPVVGGVSVSIASVSLWDGPPRIAGGSTAAGIDLLLVAAPAVAVAYAVRDRPRLRGPELGWLGSLLAGGVCTIASVGILFAVPIFLSWHFGEPGGDPLGVSVPTFVPAALVMGIFGALLGSDRRWWPWSLVPAALFLSLGPSVALLSVSGYPGVSIWSPFGAVVPLFSIGVASTWWRPMSVAISSWLERSEASDFDELPEAALTEPSREPVPRRRFRPILIPQAVAAGLLAVSVVIFVGDPSPVAFEEPLPTYLGLRTAAQDLRVKTDLFTAASAMIAYRDTHGTDRGFDAAAGARAVPSLVWLPAPSSDREIRAYQASAIAVISAPPGAPRIAAFSESGRVFCVQRSPQGRLTFGMGRGPGSGSPTVGAWREAVAGCGGRPWTSNTLAQLPTEGMCDGLDVGYLMCETVEALVAETLHAPAAVAP